MRIRNKLLGCLVAWALVSPGTGRSQTGGNDTLYCSRLPGVQKEGFYAIDLPWQAIGRARADRADFRLYDAGGREVPYWMKEDKDTVPTPGFIPYPMSVRAVPSGTEVEIETGKRPVASFVLRVKNAEAKKKATLRGSNDKLTWYVVKDRFVLQPRYEPLQTETELKIEFPMSDYACYRLSVDDSVSAPLNFLQAGRFGESLTVQRRRWQVPPAGCLIADREHETEILLTYPYAYPFSRIELYLSAPKYYRRAFRFCPASVGAGGRGDTPGAQPAADLPWKPEPGDPAISSENGPVAILPVHRYTDTLKLCIYNGDDLPLRIDSVRSYIDRYYLVAYLHPGQAYTLAYGDKKLTAPDYDLSFAAHVPAGLPHLTAGEFRAVPAENRTDALPLWKHFLLTYGIWIVIGAVILQLLYFVRKMMR